VAALVLDASVALVTVLPEPNSATAQAILARVINDGAVVPMHWSLEVANALLMAERRKTIPVGDHQLLLHQLAALPIVTDVETARRAWLETVAQAVAHRLTLYDAAYLELSLRRQLPLATFDTALRRAADATGVELV
jgi:predicted nucleic acid-binding protein